MATGEISGDFLFSQIETFLLYLFLKSGSLGTKGSLHRFVFECCVGNKKKSVKKVSPPKVYKET